MIKQTSRLMKSNEKEVIYEKSKPVGEVKTEERGGFLGFGADNAKCFGLRSMLLISPLKVLPYHDIITLVD